MGDTKRKKNEERSKEKMQRERKERYNEDIKKKQQVGRT